MPLDNVMIDQASAGHVEVRLDPSGKLWVNVDGVCALRIGQIATLQLATPGPGTKRNTAVVEEHTV